MTRFVRLLTPAAVGTALVLLLTACPATSGALLADAGPDRTVTVGDRVTLDGTGSNGTIERYTWRFADRPGGSAATLTGADSAHPAFVPDAVGAYAVELTVTSGDQHSSDRATITAVSAGAALEPGGVVEGVDGVSVGATPGALASAVDVTIERVSDASALPSLGDAAPVGSLYRLRSSQVVLTAPDAPLIVGLPVPQDRVGDPLDLAVLTPVVGHSPGDGSARPGAVWDTVDATYDAGSGLLLSPLYGFSTSPEGIVVSLVEGARPAAGQRPGGVLPQATKVGHFAGKCSVKFAAGECTPDEEQDAARFAEDFFQDMVVGLGFKKPLIRPLVADVKLTLKPPSFSASVTTAAHLIDLQPDGTLGCRNFPARYVLPLLKAYVCLPRSAANDMTGRAQTVYHEVFHSIQYHYNAATASGFQRNVYWPLIEGGANTAERSRAVMERNGSNVPHPVDVPLSRPFGTGLDPDDHDYHAQDFWVFVGLDRGVGIDYFQTLLSGPTLTTTAVDQGFRQRFGDAYGLSEAYWAWVKNQAFEAGVTGGGLLLNDPCVLDTSMLVNESTGLGGGVSLPTVTFNPAVGISGYQNLVTEDLQPLTARVYQIDLQTYGPSYFVDIGVTIDNPDIRVKFYEDYPGPTTACHATPDGKSYRAAIDGDEPIRTLYMLVANVGLTGAPTLFTQPNHELAFDELEPTVTIVSPQDAAAVDEGEVTFEAQADNPVGGTVQYRWWIDGVEAADATRVITERLCPGDHAVEVQADFGGGPQPIHARDEVTVAVRNATPTVTITDAPATAGEGNDVRFGGSVSDPTCDDPAGTRVDVDRMTWTLEDGFDGSGASLLTSFTAQGTKTVRLSYTDVSGATGEDEVSVEVAAFDPGADPVVAIVRPQPGTFFPYDEIPGGSGSDYDIELEGSASSGVSDAAMVWGYRPHGDGAWTEWARGRVGTLTLPVTPRDASYDLRLHIDGEPINDRTRQIVTITTQGVPR